MHARSASPKPRVTLRTQVNKRLEASEAATPDIRDPAFPKVQWPPETLCPLCRLPTLAPEQGVTWNLDEVYRFLLRFHDGPPASPVTTGEEHRQLVATTAVGSR